MSRSTLGSFLLFQAGWWANVFAAQAGLGVLGLLAGAVVAGLQLGLFSAQPRAEAPALLAVAALGASLDAALAQAGVLALIAPQSGALPPWLLGMWLAFASTLPRSFAGLMAPGRAGVAALVGGLGFPLAYLPGEGLGVLRFGEAAWAAPAFGLAWALGFPALLFAHARLTRRADY